MGLCRFSKCGEQMNLVYPDYYNDFRCIADKCRHSCCIGWEIDIDSESLSFYKTVEGDFGKRLRDNISLEDTPHFILDNNERCPFLNSNNLCDIYTNLGDDKLCSICREHPRFYNEFDTHTEAGLGLCCEEAARLIITKKDPVKLINLPDISGDFVLITREEILKIFQNRNLSLNERIACACEYSQNHLKYHIESAVNLPLSEIAELFKGLERLDESWTYYLELLEGVESNHEFSGFDADLEFENFITYLIIRHLPKAEFVEDAAALTAFVIISQRLIRMIFSAVINEKGDISLAERLEVMRLFSSEIEYSDENLEEIFAFFLSRISES